jgi:signal transduction histidine kinase/ActR/RegA family two-component response regulator
VENSHATKPLDSAFVEERVLVLAPTSADAVITRSLLAEAGLHCYVCDDLAGLCLEIEAGAGVILLTEEILAQGASDCLVQMLAKQPHWSDIPILLLTSSGSESPVAAWALKLLGNVAVLERPVRVTTLISGILAGLRARRRQYELRGRMDTLRIQSERLRLLWEAASVLLTTERPDAMMRGLYAKISEHLKLDAYFNFMVDEAGQSLRMESCIGIPNEEAQKISKLDYGQAICGRVAQLRQPITATNIRCSAEPMTQLVKSLGFQVYACNPLLAGERLLGTLSFASKTRTNFNEDELDFLKTVCQYVAYAYERLRLIRQLREEDEKKDEFLATLAHELRNPLAPIRNAAQYMRLKGPAEPGLQNAREIIDRQVRQMTRLVDDLLDISRISRGKIELKYEKVSIGLVLANAIESSRPLIDHGKHQLTVDLPTDALIVNGDSIRLTQVFGNLLTNAAKYTDPGGSIRIGVASSDGEVVVSVKDTGIGIAPEYLPRLFDMFSQVDPALERTQGGLGIGLALVRSLVEMHAGKVEAFSDGLSTGSEFVVRLPLFNPPHRNQRHPESAAPIVNTLAKPKSRILVVDDNVDSAESMAMMLSMMGNEVITAHDGLEAVELADKFRPELILMDVGMPKLNGFEATRCIREQPWGKKTAIVALTGWGQDEYRQKSHEAGCDSHLVKPVDPATLEGLLTGLQVTKK